MPHLLKVQVVLISELKYVELGEGNVCMFVPCIVDVLEMPGMRIASQRLQIVRFTEGSLFFKNILINDERKRVRWR
jgi:hypothetical protein